MTKKIRIPKKFIKVLAAFPEQGMGYQEVMLVLKDGTIIKSRHIFNSTFLQLEENEIMKTSDIKEIELEKR